MFRLLAKRLATGAVTLFLVTVLVFAIVHLAPGDPLAETVGSGGLYRLTPETERYLTELLHLDAPLHRRYLLWLGDVLRGDLGQSFNDRRPVFDKIAERLPISMTLNTLALAVMLLISVPLGAAAAWKPASRIDRLAGLGTYALYAVPVFWAGLLLQILFAVQLDWLPLAGLTSEGFESLGPVQRFVDRVAHLILPVVCLSYGGLAYLSRFVRAAILDNMGAEAALAARARGLSSIAVLYRHGFRLAAVPMLTLAGFLLPALVGGSVIVESIFAIPGLGELFIKAAAQRDVPVLMGITLLSGAATLAGILAADLTYAIADPRVRRG